MTNLQKREYAAFGLLSILLVSCILLSLNPCLIAIPSIDGLLLLVVLAVFPVLFVFFFKAPKASQVRRIGYTSAILGIFILYSVGLSRFTDLGILALGGDGYWLGRAAAEQHEQQRECCLRVALSGTEYALNTVETKLLNDYADEPTLQADLFDILARLAPNEGWAWRYRFRRDEALKRSNLAGSMVDDPREVGRH